MIFDSPEANQRLSDTAAEAPPATFMERFQAADKQAQASGLITSRLLTMSEDYDRRIKAIKDAGLGDLSDINPMTSNRRPQVYSEGHSIYDMEPLDFSNEPHKVFQKRLEELAQKYPEQAHIIGADKPVTGSQAYQAAKKEAEATSSSYGGAPLTGPIADFAGGMYAMRKDPANIVALGIGPTSHVGKGAKAVLMMGAKQAAANMAVETAMQPFIQSWRKSMNDTYGFWQSAEEIAMAGAFGFGADVGVRSLYRGVQSSLGRKAILDAEGKVTGYESGADAAARAAAAAEHQRRIQIQQNLEALPKDTFDKIAQGDDEALTAFAKAVKADEDPSMAGAINALRNTDRVTLDGIDDGWRERSLLQQLRSLEDPSEPAPVHFDSAAKAERPRLADDAELPRGTEGNQHYRMLDIDGKPVRFEAVDANRITTEPETFQFKGGRDSAGASNALRAVDFDGNVKGKVIVYEREDGSLVVADGHDRVSLANRAPEPQKLDALVFREKDGWTAEQVRAEAARKNIQEGTGSLMDVAGAIRRHPEIVDDSMAVSTDFMADARSIARLSDEAFDAVAGGQFNPKHGVLVSDHVPDQARHMEVLRELDRRNPPTEAAARREIGNMLREPANIETLARVMDIPLAEPHVIEARNDVLAGVLTTMRSDVETQAIAAVIRRLAEKPGLVSDVLAQAGRAVAEGQPLERAIDATLRRFEDVIGKAGVKGLADQPVRLSPTEERPRFLAALSDLAQRNEAVLLDDVGPNDPPPRSVLAFHGTNREANFDQLSLPDSEFGVHFGTTAQADYVAKKFGNVSPSYDRSRLFPTVLTTRRVLTMDDLAGWFADDIALEIGAAKRYDAEFPGLRNDVKGVTTKEQLRDVFAKHQIDAIRYRNAAEGDGWSYLVWDSATAKSATSGADVIARNQNITPAKIAELAENLRQALDEATTPPPGRLDDPIKDAPKQVERLREDLAEDIAVAMGQPSPAQLAAIRAFHGSPHDFDKFDLSKIGTGEGAQAFGHGLYFAENEGVAKSYRDSTTQDVRSLISYAGPDRSRNAASMLASDIPESRVLEGLKALDDPNPEASLVAGKRLLDQARNAGKMYEVNIKADPADFLDWDKPLSQQSEKVRGAALGIRNAAARADYEKRGFPETLIQEYLGNAATADKTGGQIVQGMKGANQSGDFSQALREAGIPGIRYLDQGSRTSGEGSRNYVVFDDNLVEIVAKDGKPVTPEEKKNILADMRRQQYEERAAKQQAEQSQQPAQASPLLDLYQRYVTQGREALDAVMPGTGRMIDEFVQANPEVVARIAEALGAPTGRPQATQMLEQALPQFTNPRIIDMSKPVLLTPEANARMREIRTAIDETVKMLPPEYRIRVEDSLVFNFGDGDKRLDGLHDGYEKLIYVSMAAGDPVRTSRHEVIHALRQSGLMKDEEFSALYKFADRLGLRKAYEIDTQYKAPYTEAYGNRGADFVEQLLREETVANMFSDYSLNGRRFGDVAGGGMVDRLIDMIVTFMKQVRDIMGGYGFRNVYDVFESIESGAMARRGMGQMDGADLASVRQPLDMSPEARKARAEQMGFDTGKVWYHGTTKDFDAFDPKKANKANGMPRAVFLAEEPSTANYFARSQDGSRAIPVYLKRGEYFDFRNEEHASALEKFLDGKASSEIVPGYLGSPKASTFIDSMKRGDWGILERPAVQKWLKKNGYVGWFARESADGPLTVAVTDPTNIRSVNATFDPASAGSARLLAMFAGENAKTANVEALAKAKQMDAEDKPREAIWKDTGWFKGVDGKWRFEISDHKAYFDENAAKDLKDILAEDGKSFDYMKDTWPFGGVVGHRDLFGAYPALSDLQTHFIPNSKFGSIKAAFSDKGGGRISFNDALDAESGRSYGLHESQHAIQAIESFARGGRHDNWPKEMLEAERARIAAEQAARPKLDEWTIDNSIAPADMTDVDLGRSLYRRLAGEAEARLVQKRMNMTPEERRARPPWLDYDVPEADQIVRMANEAIQMSIEDKPLARDLADVQQTKEGHDVLAACKA